MDITFEWQEQYLTSKRRDENIKSISLSYRRVMFYLLYRHFECSSQKYMRQQKISFNVSSIVGGFRPPFLRGSKGEHSLCMRGGALIRYAKRGSRVEQVIKYSVIEGEGG